MNQKLLSLCLFIISCTGNVISQEYSKDEKLIMANFDQQATCWNQGDIDCYCQGYVHSPDVHTVSSKGFTYGYDAIVAKYKKDWPKERMGKLHFDQVKMEKLSKITYLVQGRFNLEYEQSKPLSGYFTVIMKKIGGKWLMYTDHSS
ncbi:MAG: nuclear transport factor 2 family protein [Saprospiraceae bacterium]